MEWKQTKQLLKWAAPVSLALVLAACGGNDNKDKADPSPSTSPSAIVSASPSPSPSASASPEASAGMKKYENADQGISMEYPSDWTLNESVAPALVAFVSPVEGADDKAQENINIVVEDLKGQSYTLEQYMQATEAGIKKLYSDAEFYENDNGTLKSGESYITVAYSTKPGDVKLRFGQIIAIKNGKAYVVTATVEDAKADAYSDKIDSIMETIELK